MKYILTLLLILSSSLMAKRHTFVYYNDPMAVPLHVYDINCDVKTCKKGYTRAGDVDNTRARCWCSKYKVFKARVLSEEHTSQGEPYYIVTQDCESAWIVYSDDIIKVEEE